MGVADDPYRAPIAGWSSRRAPSIPEELLLLVDSVWGRRVADRDRPLLLQTVGRPLAAGRLIALVLAGRVAVGSTGRGLRRREVLLVRDVSPTGDSLLDDDLERIAGSKLRSYGYWIDHPAKGSAVACWDRLVERSLVRRDDMSDASRYVADANALAATTERIRAVLAEPERADLREVALVTLLAHSKTIGALQHQTERTPVGLVERYLAKRRNEKLGRRAIGNYKRFVVPLLGEDQRNWAIEAADAIDWIAQHAAPESGWFDGGG
jgi:hypothetical protein